MVSAGQLGVVAAAGASPALVGGGTGPQFRQALANLAAVLATEGATLDQVVKATVFLVDLDDFGLVNDIWAEAFPAAGLARSAVGAASLPLGARVEIEAWAFAPVNLEG